MIHLRRIAFAAVLLAGAVAGPLDLVSPVLAQTPPEFDELLPGQLPECPQAIENKFPKCAIAMLVTTEEKWVACYCKGNVSPKDGPTFSNPVTKRRSAVVVEKLVPPGGGADPCGLMTINGKKKYVCW